MRIIVAPHDLEIGILVEGRFALGRATAAMAQGYDEVISMPVTRRPGETFATAVRAGRAELRLHDPRYKRARAQARQSRLAAARGTAQSYRTQETHT